MSLALIDADVPDRSLALWWLGQAGFVFKTPGGKVVYVDPYLSDAVERLFGFKRMTLPPIAAEDVRADLVVLTHEHADHLDPDSLPAIAINNPGCRFAAPAGCAEGLAAAGVRGERFVLLEPNRRYDVEGVVICTAKADHGDLSETALCLVLEFGPIRIACTGDTAFRPELLKPLYEARPDVLLPCINGAFGNMGHVDAAMLTQAAKPRYAIPCHFWTFAEHGAADPAGFVHACRSLCPETQSLLLRPGERFVVPPR
ncbi:MAG TPA: MBL fold metallo-hydrolase [Thermoguttaceae bacterium]|nr:MBL fold metallo-hydrolase [Thermoguttaceae bacterium]